jgi:hypothetical protein|tara:strand:- start:37 stop:321 length:285 start_codon:yes stop_codon:yes gene_type:complete
MTHDELIAKWESLFTNEYGEPTLTYLEIPECWYPLVDTLCSQIQSHLIQTPDACHVQVVQIKEKFGGLRFYTTNHDPYIEGMIRIAEAYSYHIQ